MAENEVIVPTSGNPALDPTRVESGLVASSPAGKHWSEMVEENYENSRRLLSEGDRQKEQLKEYWDARKRKKEDRPRNVQTSGGGGGEFSRSSGRSVQFGASNSTSPDYGMMRFKSRIMQDAASVKYTCAFPLNTHFPQVCGPFRPVTISSQGGSPQSSLQESMGTGIVPNMDA